MPEKWTQYLLSILRIVAALLFFEHGTQKLFGYPPGPPFTGFPNFSLLGIAGMLEVVGGSLLLLGLFTRVTAFIGWGDMAVVYFRACYLRRLFPHNNTVKVKHTLCILYVYF